MDSDLEYIYEQYVESSDGSSDEEEYSDETAMMQAVLQDAERAEEYVLNFKGSIKDHRVLNCNRGEEEGMAPMKVYGWAVSPWMARVLVCLEEAGAEYELVPMSRNGGDHRRPEHLARNPFGEIPVLEDGDLTLYQSRAIARHILRKYKPELLGGGSLEESAMVDVWVDVDAHQLEPVLKPIVLNCIINPFVGRDVEQGLIDESVEKLKKLLEVYEARLSSSKYLAGDCISFADLTHFSFMRYFIATEHAVVLDAYPHAKAWWESLLARPSVKKVIAGMPPDFGFGSGNIP